MGLLGESVIVYSFMNGKDPTTSWNHCVPIRLYGDGAESTSPLAGYVFIHLRLRQWHFSVKPRTANLRDIRDASSPGNKFNNEFADIEPWFSKFILRHEPFQSESL